MPDWMEDAAGAAMPLPIPQKWLRPLKGALDWAKGSWRAWRGAKVTAQAARIGPKIAKQMGSRGWTREAVEEAMKSGKKLRAVNKATGNAATRYVHPTTGQSVVVDDVTGEVIHVGGPGFRYGPGSGDLP